jgi:hypothetical protein
MQLVEKVAEMKGSVAYKVMHASEDSELERWKLSFE